MVAPSGHAPLDGEDERDEHDSLLDVYMRAMEAGPAPVAKAA